MAGKTMTFRLPNDTHRTAIIGKTGSGKTQFAAFLLSRSPFHKIPYIIVDYKRDALLNSVDRIRRLGYKDRLPSRKQPGLYIIHPMPHEEAEMEEWLWKVWSHERIGLFFDEGTLVPGNRAGARSGAFQAIQQQGRSKKIPAITVTQRPAGVSRQVFSEADFFACFYLNTKPDIDRVREMMPQKATVGLAQDYHCRWYDVGQDRLTIFSPSPDADTIRSVLHDRLAPVRRFF